MRAAVPYVWVLVSATAVWALAGEGVRRGGSRLDRSAGEQGF
jgi:hypothetical protein